MNYELNSLTKDIARLCMRRPFYASILLPLQKEVKSVGTACTDGKSLIVDPNWFGSLNQLQRETVLMHEALHIILLHNVRRGNRNPADWNIAGDYVINSLLADDVHEFPEVGCIEPHLLKKYSGWTTEKVYDDLIKEHSKESQDDDQQDDEQNQSDGQSDDDSQDQSGQDGQNDEEQDPSDGSDDNGESGTIPTPSKPLMGEVHDMPDMDNDSEKDAQEKVLQAQSLAKAMGTMPDNIEKAIADIVEPAKLSWEEQLKKWVEEKTPTDWSWSKPDPIFMPSNILMPTLDGDANGLILVAIDTSASMDSDQIATAVNELNEILSTQMSMGEANLQFITCDTRCSEPKTLSDPSEIPQIRGGGGTRFTPVFDFANNMEEPPKAVIYLTDGEAYDFPPSPDYDTLWLVTEKNPYYTVDHFPFGEVIFLHG